MAVKKEHKKYEKVTNETKMSWNYNSNEDKGKYIQYSSNPPVSKPVTSELHWRLHGRPVQRNHNSKILIGNLALLFLSEKTGFEIQTSLALPDVREAMAVLDSGLHAMDSRFQVMDSSLCQWNKC